MRWEHLLFAHWPVSAAILRPLVPPQLDLLLWGGDAWVGVVPFAMSRIRPLNAGLPRGGFDFDEVNVRTYVGTRDGTEGVWFLSLDGDHLLGSLVARIAFGIPYRRASVRVTSDGERIRATVVPSAPAHPSVDVRYQPVGPAIMEPDPLDAFLTDRLVMFGLRRGRLLRAEVEHDPWPLRRAEARFDRLEVPALGWERAPGTMPHLRYARSLDVRFPGLPSAAG